MTDIDYDAHFPLGSYNTKNYRLDGSTLTINVLVWTGETPEWLDSTIDLNQHLGVEERTDKSILVLGERGLFDSNLDPAPFLEIDDDLQNEIQLPGDDTVKISKNPQFLHIKDEDGWMLDLTRIIFVDRSGHLDFKKLPDNLADTCSCLFIEDDHILNGFCERYDGYMVCSSIDLRSCYMANIGYKLVSVGTLTEEDRERVKAMTQPVLRNLKLEGTILTAEAKLEEEGDKWSEPQTIDLAICIVNINGNFAYRRHDAALDRDGPVTKFFEGVPLFNIMISPIHRWAGNGDHEKRALGAATNSTIIWAAGTFGGLIGGPIGAAICVAVATPFAMKLQAEIGREAESSTVRDESPEVTLDLIKRNMTVNILGVAAGSVLSKFFGTITKQVCKNLGTTVEAELKKEFSSLLAQETIYEKVSDAMFAKYSEMFNQALVDRIKPDLSATKGKPVWKNNITQILPEDDLKGESRPKRETEEEEEPPVLEDKPEEEEAPAEEEEPAEESEE